MRILAITKRVLMELFRDKRTLALMFLAPILIMWLMNVMFSANSNTTANIATVNVSQSMQTNLKKVDGVSVTPTSARQAQRKLKNNSTDAIIKYDQKQNRYNVTYANTDSSKTVLTKQALKAAIKSGRFPMGYTSCKASSGSRTRISPCPSKTVTLPQSATITNTVMGTPASSPRLSPF